jgi:hypothetical protein
MKSEEKLKTCSLKELAELKVIKEEVLLKERPIHFITPAVTIDYDLFSPKQIRELLNIIVLKPSLLYYGEIKVKDMQITLTYTMEEYHDVIRDTVEFNNLTYKTLLVPDTLSYFDTVVNIMVAVARAIFVEIAINFKWDNVFYDIKKKLTRPWEISITVRSSTKVKIGSNVKKLLDEAFNMRALLSLKDVDTKKRKEFKDYLIRMKYINEDYKLLVHPQNLRFEIHQFEEGNTPRICPYCEKKFWAKGKRVYCSDSCKVAYFNKRVLIGRQVILEDNKKGTIIDVKRGYFIVESNKEILKARYRSKLRDLPVIKEIVGLKKNEMAIANT